MGNSGFKSKKRKQIIIVNSNASEINVDISEDSTSPDLVDAVYKAPILKWHKANPREDILKIQRDAEIRDIEIIYENTQMKEGDLLNMMPDHYWSGMENKLPRYVLYRGNYPDGNQDKVTNLHRIKSSSLNDLTDSLTLYFKDNNDEGIDNQSTRPMFRSISCPHFNQTLVTSLSKIEKDVPIKGILKNRKTNRPNSVMLVDIRVEKTVNVQLRHDKLIPVVELDSSNQITNGLTTNNSRTKVHKKISKITQNIQNGIGSLLRNHSDEDNTFSGYFDQSTDRIQDGSLLTVNPDKKTWIKTNLDKRLNLRPTSMDLTNRNILHDQDEYNRQTDFEQTRCALNEKLSDRPTLTELKKKKIIKFSDFVEIQETDNYDRSIARPWGRLSEVDKESIRNELNEFKDKEMKTHLRSKKFTKFHDIHHE